MESERAGDHHAALARDLPLGLVGNPSHLARHDPMRLPDALLRRADTSVRAVGAESERFNQSLNLSSRSAGFPEHQSDEDWEPPLRASRQGRNGEERRAGRYTRRPRGYEPGDVSTDGDRSPILRSPSPFESARVLHQRARPSSLPYPRAADYEYGPQGILEISTSQPYQIGIVGSTRTIYRENPTPSRPSPHDTMIEADRPLRRQRLYNMDKERGLSSGSPSQERQALPSATLPHRRRPAIVCQTVSRDETSSEEAKKTSLVKAAMEPHTRRAQMGKAFRADTRSIAPDNETGSSGRFVSIWDRSRFK